MRPTSSPSRPARRDGVVGRSSRMSAPASSASASSTPQANRSSSRFRLQAVDGRVRVSSVPEVDEHSTGQPGELLVREQAREVLGRQPPADAEAAVITRGLPERGEHGRADDRERLALDVDLVTHVRADGVEAVLAQRDLARPGGRSALDDGRADGPPARIHAEDGHLDLADRHVRVGDRRPALQVGVVPFGQEPVQDRQGRTGSTPSPTRTRRRSRRRRGGGS